MWRNKKGKVRRIWKITGIVLLLLYFLPLLARILPFGMDQVSTRRFFDKKHMAFTDSTIMLGDQKVRFVATGRRDGRIILLIHGSPGSWNDLKSYLTDSTLLAQGFRIIAFDRPGYGQSGGPGSPHLEDQAKAAAAILSVQTNKEPALVMGHSYGGPVAIKLATMHASEIGGLLLVSPTVAPRVEESITIKRILQNYTRFWAFHWMMDDILVHSTNEMRPLPQEVRKMEKDYRNIECPVVELHGTKDWMAPFANQAYVCNSFVCTKVDTIAIHEGDHFLIWSMHNRVTELLVEMSKYKSAEAFRISQP